MQHVEHQVEFAAVDAGDPILQMPRGYQSHLVQTAVRSCYYQTIQHIFSYRVEPDLHLLGRWAMNLINAVVHEAIMRFSRVGIIVTPTRRLGLAICRRLAIDVYAKSRECPLTRVITSAT